MENATKALLIAAAVLITIVVIALGIRLLKSTGSTSEQATTVANNINDETDKAVNKLKDKLLGTQNGGTSTGSTGENSSAGGPSGDGSSVSGGSGGTSNSVVQENNLSVKPKKIKDRANYCKYELTIEGGIKPYKIKNSEDILKDNITTNTIDIELLETTTIIIEDAKKRKVEIELSVSTADTMPVIPGESTY